MSEWGCRCGVNFKHNEVRDSDPVRVRRIDKLGTIHFDPERKDGALATVDPDTGFLRVDARLTRTGVFLYGDADGNEWGELRTDEEVFDGDALRSFEITCLTDDHPPEFVSSSNVRDVQVGSVGSDVRRDGDFVVASMLVTDPKTIAKIRDGKTELSCGYTAHVIQDSGVTDDGTPYAGRQTCIRGNHVAVVDLGRAGPACRMLIDAGAAVSIHPGIQVKTKKKTQDDSIVIGGEEIEIDPRVAEFIMTLQAAAETEAAEEMPEEDAPGDDDEEPPMHADANALRARVDVLEAAAKTRSATEADRIDARVSLVTAARAVLGADTPTRGVSDAKLMRAVVLNVSPTLAGRLDANKSTPGYLVAAYDAAMDLHLDRGVAEAEATSAIFDTLNSGSTEDLDAAYNDYLSKRSKVRLVAQGEG